MANYNVSNQPDDLGFGTRVTSNHERLLNKDGKSNVIKTGRPKYRPYDIYQRLITMGWSRLILLIFLGYMGINLIFSALYMAAGVQHLLGSSKEGFWYQFEDAFFFSSQTITTLGYGHLSPSGLLTSSIAAIESMMGVLSFALATGLLYGRFSRPQANILFSKHILIAPYTDHTGLMFRIANMRSSELIDVDVNVVLSRNEHCDGRFIRRFYPLKLERTSVNLLSMTWTIVHPIDDKSPLSNKTYEDIAESDVEIMVMIKGFDDTFSQTVHTRTSYKFDEFIFDAKFVPVIGTDETGVTIVQLERISDYERTQPVARGKPEKDLLDGLELKKVKVGLPE